MAIKRIDFLFNQTVAGPRGEARQSFMPSKWPGWTATLKANLITLEEEATGKTIEIPRNWCVVYQEPDAEPAGKERAA